MLSGPLCLSLLIPQLPFSLVLYPSFLVVASALICLHLEDYATVRNPVSRWIASVWSLSTTCLRVPRCALHSSPAILRAILYPPPKTHRLDHKSLLPITFPLYFLQLKQQLVHYHKGSLSFPDRGPAFLPLTYAFWSLTRCPHCAHACYERDKTRTSIARGT